MSFLTGLCNCFSVPCISRLRPEETPRCSPQPTVVSGNNHNPNQPIVHQGGGSDGDGRDDSGDGYAPVVPLPQYTPRPVSVNEKTLEAHMRDPPISSSSVAMDEKNQGLDSFDEVISDTSSAISFPSSYGNTSTATRETPPPPYSPNPSPTRSRPTSMSDSSMIVPPSEAHLSQPPPPFLPPAFSYHSRMSRRFSVGEAAARRRRFSCHSR